MRGPKIEIYRSFNHHGCRCMTPCSDPGHQEFRWRHRAANGRIISDSGEGYIEPRNLVRGLELAHPGYVLAVHTLSAKLGPESWCLRANWQNAYPTSTNALGHIPVTVPEGTESLWAARRKR